MIIKRETAWLSALAMMAALLLSVNASAVPLPATGPDAFGYSGSAITNNLRDISSTGTPLILSDDETSGALNIGFNFGFYGNSYSQAYVSSNGFMGFTAGMGDGCCSGLVLPEVDSYNNLIAGLWQDLDPDYYYPPTISVFYQTLGAVGSREFVVGFYDVQHIGGIYPVTFEMILHEATNNIELQYGSIESDYDKYHTVGIENATGTVGLQVFRGDQDLDFDNTGYLITTSQVPESATLSLMGLGLAGIGYRRRQLMKA